MCVQDEENVLYVQCYTLLREIFSPSYFRQPNEASFELWYCLVSIFRILYFLKSTVNLYNEFYFWVPVAVCRWDFWLKRLLQLFGEA